MKEDITQNLPIPPKPPQHLETTYTSPDRDLIEELIFSYIQDEHTTVVTKPGIYNYLLTVQRLKPNLVRYIKQEIRKDAALSFLLNTLAESKLVEGALLGFYKEATAKLLLKNHFGYQESIDDNSSEAMATRRLVLQGIDGKGNKINE